MGFSVLCVLIAVAIGITDATGVTDSVDVTDVTDITSVTDVTTVTAVTDVTNDVVVPLCCPVGWIVAGIKRHDEFDVDIINCKQTKNPFIEEFVPIQNLATRVYHPECEDILTLRFGVSKLTNVSFRVQVKKMLSRPYGSNFCFDFSARKSSNIYFCDPMGPQYPTVHWAKSTVSGLSVILLVVSALLYSAVRGLATNPHSPYIVAHNLSLAMAFVCRISLQFIQISDTIPACVCIAFAVQFFTMAAFFWMSAMCLDVHITIRNRLDDEFVTPVQDYSRMLPPKDRRSPYNKKFAFLSLYAWGVPLLMTILAIYLEFMDVLPEESPFKPNIARWNYSCFFTGPSARWYLFKWPIALSVVMSVALFIATAVGLYQHERSMSTIQQNNRFSNDKRYFFLYLKLFVIMGITWGFGWTLDTSVKSYYSSTKGTAPGYFSYVFLAMDYIFCFQGVFVFLLFICKKRTLNILFEQFQSLKFLRCASRENDDSGSATADQGVGSAVSKETIL